ncbi:MAG TPA: hypothetical protein DEG13_11525 [Candidatus Microthrix parvicella]|nr:hypothetical protein [Candidatus Microthrix parvicella]
MGDGPLAALAGDERLVPMAINTSAVTSHPAILRPVRVSVAGPAGACVAPATSAAGAAPAPSPSSGLFADVVALHRDVQLAAGPIDITVWLYAPGLGRSSRYGPSTAAGLARTTVSNKVAIKPCRLAAARAWTVDRP